MSDRRFPILGGVVPPMLGREAIMQRMLGALTKPTPDHIQVVGPHFVGKTVILHELARRLSKMGTPYSAVLLWDVGHQTPATDELFMQRFAQELSIAISVRHPVYAGHLNSVQDNPYQDIAEVLDAIKEDGGKVLVIMDSFDKPLSFGQLTRNLWDQLRALGEKSSLRYVTASRKTLRQLIRHPEIEMSPFFNLFDISPVRVECFDEQDISEILGKLEGVVLNAGAKTELLNATNGFPLLLLEVLNAVCDGNRDGEVKPDTVVAVYDQVLPALSGTIETLWGECSSSSQDLMRRVIDERSVSHTGIAKVDAEILIERGFVHQTGNKLQRPNRLLIKFLDERPNEGNALARMFSGADVYLKHFKGVMERRISHLTDIDSSLKRFLERGAEDLPEHPDVFLGNVHGILERALTLVWKAECWNADSNKPQIPSEWFFLWRNNSEKGFEGWQTSFPEGGQRLRLLDMMSGTQKSDRLSTYVTKNTYAIANAVQGFRDFGVHPKATNIDPGTAYAALHLCIELAASLARELPTPTGATQISNI
ncbi:P-loop NTPase family protein [Thiobacillus sp.]